MAWPRMMLESFIAHLEAQRESYFGSALRHSNRESLSVVGAVPDPPALSIGRARNSLGPDAKPILLPALVLPHQFQEGDRLWNRALNCLALRANDLLLPATCRCGARGRPLKDLSFVLR